MLIGESSSMCYMISGLTDRLYTIAFLFALNFSYTMKGINKLPMIANGIKIVSAPSFPLLIVLRIGDYRISFLIILFLFSTFSRSYSCLDASSSTSF